MNRPETPECDKLAAIADQSQEIGEFLDWLGEQGIRLASYTQWDEPVLVEISDSFERLLARYFEIDLDKVDREKWALLKWLRSQHETGEAT